MQAGFSRASFFVGSGGSKIIWNSTNARTVYCTGLWPAYGAIPVNQGWEGDWIVYNYSGKTNCVVTAQNAIGDVVTVYPELNVYELDSDANRVMNCISGRCAVPSTPSLPASTGITSSQPLGYVDPATGLVYSDPQGTEPCGSCRSDLSMTTNDGNDVPTASYSGGEGE